jgi:hypothetical protein
MWRVLLRSEEVSQWSVREKANLEPESGSREEPGSEMNELMEVKKYRVLE